MDWKLNVRQVVGIASRFALAIKWFLDLSGKNSSKIGLDLDKHFADEIVRILVKGFGGLRWTNVPLSSTR
jgi:hypothetical protein